MRRTNHGPVRDGAQPASTAVGGCYPRGAPGSVLHRVQPCSALALKRAAGQPMLDWWKGPVTQVAELGGWHGLADEPEVAPCVRHPSHVGIGARVCALGLFSGGHVELQWLGLLGVGTRWRSVDGVSGGEVKVLGSAGA